jgi:hypothetical protein
MPDKIDLNNEEPQPQELHASFLGLRIRQLPLHRRVVTRGRATLRQGEIQIQIQAELSEVGDRLHPAGPQGNALQEDHAPRPETLESHLPIRRQLELRHRRFRTSRVLRLARVSLRSVRNTWLRSTRSH